MNFNYSICIPDKEEIQYPKETLSPKQVLEFGKNYPWQEQNELCDSLSKDKQFYSPSLDFKNDETKHSLSLTADSNNGEVIFSLWYNRPKKIKKLFGLLGTKEKMVLDDVWAIHFEDSMKCLEYFVNEEYELIEELFQNKTLTDFYSASIFITSL